LRRSFAFLLEGARLALVLLEYYPAASANTTLQTKELEQFASARGWNVAGVYVHQGAAVQKIPGPN
jgi:hypothetical protein